MLLLKKMMKYLVHTEILGCQKKKENQQTVKCSTFRQHTWMRGSKSVNWFNYKETLSHGTVPG